MKWFLLAAAVVCHVAYAASHSTLCEYGSGCMRCAGVASREACQQLNKFKECRSDQVCKETWKIDQQLQISSFSSKCNDICRPTRTRHQRNCRNSLQNNVAHPSLVRETGKNSFAIELESRGQNRLITCRACTEQICLPPTLPCEENPGVCNTGECLNELSHPDGYVCDCVNTGMTGDHCEIPAGSQCGEFQGVYCKVCTGAASEAECDSFGTPTICPEADAVCELSVNYDLEDEISSVSRSCIAHADCASLVLGDDDCNGYTGKRSVMARSVSRSCTTCEAGECFDKPECADDSLYCYKCHSHSESGCWVAGHYELCDPGSMCFYRNTKNSAGRDVFERGCMTQQQCLNPSSGLSCGLGSAEPPAPEKPLYSCSKPSVGTCFCKGDPHCMTADGVYIPQVSGPCLTTFVRDNCISGQPEHSGTPTFVVAVNPDYLSNSKVAVQAVHITTNIGGTTTSMKFSTVTGFVSIDDAAAVSIVDNNNMDPYEVNGHTIEMVSEDIVRVMLSNGVSIDWNFNKEVATHVPHSMMGSTCGICGNFDGTPAGDYSGGPSNSGVCPNENNVSLGPGEAVTAGKEEDFAMTWVAGIDSSEARCCESCGLNADLCQ